MSAFDVAIVGAGPVGLTLAGLLARGGLQVVLLERLPERNPLARASHLHGSVLEGMRALGVTDPLLHLGRATQGARLFSDGALVTEVSTADLAVRYPFSLALPQPMLEAVLEDAATRWGARVERGVEVTQILGADPVQLRCKGRGRVQASWVVGCDGAGSHVRSAMGATLRGVTRDGLALADVDVEGDLHTAELHTSRDGVAIRIPMMRGERWVTQAPPLLHDVPARLLERIPSAPRPTGVSWVSPFRVHARWSPTWRKGALLLAGDAAHLHSPVGGHGMNTGLLDALDLAWKLELVVRGGAPSTLLDSYARSRRRAARASVVSAWVATMGLVARAWPLRRFRDWTSGAIGRFASGSLAQWSLGWDVRVPGIERAKGGISGAGARAIDVPLSTGWMLDGLYRLTVLGESVDLPVDVDVRPLPESHPFGNAESVLIRPDGFVAYRGARAGLRSATERLLAGAI